MDFRERLKERIFHFHREKGYLADSLQRVWELLWTCDRLPEDANSVIFDTGCGAEARFANILRKFYHFVYCNDVMPAEFESDPCKQHGILYMEGTTQEIIERNRPVALIDCVTCISVLEHVEDKESFCKALDSIPAPLLITLEFCYSSSRLAKELITLPVLTECLGYFTNHYVSSMTACPIHASNSNDREWYPLAIELLPNGKECKK